MSTTTQAPKSKAHAGRASGIRSGPAKPSRELMIAEAAYYIAEKRGFASGDHVKDWLDAEAQIDQQSMVGKRKAPAK